MKGKTREEKDLLARYSGDPVLAAEVRGYAEASVSDNTRRAYRASLKHFIEWGGQIPASPEQVALYLATHAETLSCATLRTRIAAIRKAHVSRGLPDPTDTDLPRGVMRGILRLHGAPQKKASPIMLEELLAMFEATNDDLAGCRDRALLLTGFFGALRRSEISNLTIVDLDFRKEGLLLTIRRSKTDQEGHGQTIAIARQDNGLCPVSTLRAWLEKARIQDGPVFRSVDNRGNVSTTPLSPNGINKIVKRLARRAGMDPERYSAHSLRAGFATSAAKLEVEERLIQKQTRHRSLVTLRGYIREGMMFGHGAQETLAKALSDLQRNTNTGG